MIADGPKLKQSIDNLLSNAVKFTPDGESICLTAKRVPGYHPQAAPGEWIEISVTDTGIGLKEVHASFSEHEPILVQALAQDTLVGYALQLHTKDMGSDEHA